MIHFVKILTTPGVLVAGTLLVAAPASELTGSMVVHLEFRIPATAKEFGQEVETMVDLTWNERADAAWGPGVALMIIPRVFKPETLNMAPKEEAGIHGDLSEHMT